MADRVAERRGSAGGQQLDVPLEVERPAVLGGDAVAGSLPAVAVTLEVPVDQADPGPAVALRGKRHLDLARPLEILRRPPVGADVPAEDEPGRRLVGEHPRPAAPASVAAAVVD